MRHRTDRPLLHARASAESIAMVRIWVFILCMVEALPPLEHLAELPLGSFDAFGFFRPLPTPMLDALLSSAGLTAIRWTALLTAAAAALGIATRSAMVAATLSLILYQGVTRGFQGFVNHAQLPLILFAVVLTVAPADRALTLWPRRRTPVGPSAAQYTLLTLTALLCVGYLFIGAHRVAYGGLELFTSRSLQEWIVSWNLVAPAPAATLGVRTVTHPLLSTIATLSFPLITALEVSAPLCLLSAGYRRLFVPAMLLVHVGIYLLMRINFIELALLYVVFVDSRRWSPTARQSTGGIVFFDGVCGLCNQFVDFLLVRDRRGWLRFAPLQGRTADAQLPAGRVSADPDSIVYVEDGMQDRSTAVLSAVSRLGGAWSFVALLGLVPRPIRDWVYDVVATHRYRWFGRREQCRLPTDAERAAFLP